MGVIGASFMSAIVGKVIDKGLEYLNDQYNWQTGMKDDLKTLKRSIPQIQAVVRDADAGHVSIEDGPLRDWWWQLRDALYAAADVLDDFEYLRLQELVLNASSPSSSSSTDSIPLSKVRKLRISDTASSIKKKAVQIGMRTIKQDPVLKRLREVVHMFDDVCDGLDLFERLVTKEQQRQQQQHEEFMASRETSSILTTTDKFRFVGRHEEREKIVESLLNSSDRESADGADVVSLVSIVGHGGMGKTTLAQHVFNDKRVDDHFDLKIWVYISNNFNLTGLTKSILQSATKNKPEVDTLTPLQDELRKVLTACKRFLLVLDDAWNDKSSSDWGKLFAPLIHGPAGSKILLTTRLDTVAEMAEKGLMGRAMQQTRTWLKGLAEDEYMLLFNEHAFAGMKNTDCLSKLQSIGMKIGAKLGGSPLATKVVGDMLNSNMSEGYWEKILDKDISKFEEGQNGIISTLKLSYCHLPEQLRPCFAYCSIFPPDYKFSKDDLVYMWMAMGFIQQSSEGPTEALEDIGGRYFEHLLKRSFFEHVHGLVEERYAVHDLLREMAEYVSRDECIRFSRYISKPESLDRTRHLSFINTDLRLLGQVQNHENWAKLHTLHLVYDSKLCEEHLPIIKKVLEASKGVRILTLSVPIMEALPDSIGILTHLKYFRIFQPTGYRKSWPSIQLPNSLSKLYNLQAINMAEPHYCREFVFPPDMNNLISLRHLIPEDVSKEIAGVGKLTSLMELVFTVKEESEYKIEELKGINQLRRLKIKGLENAMRENEAALQCKEHLRQLTLKWSLSRSKDSNKSFIKHDEQVIEHLRPNSKIKNLVIKGYMGAKSADWMYLKSIENLENVRIDTCPNWEQLPPLKNLPYLKYLYLKNVPAVKCVGFDSGFQQLKVLEIVGLEKLDEWSDSAGAMRFDWCPHLRVLNIRDCQDLKVLPALPLSLEQVELGGVGLTALPKLSCSNSKSSSSSPLSPSSLSHLKIASCKRLKTLDAGLLVQQHRLGALTYLSIEDCDELEHFPVEGFQHLCSLEELHVERCPKLQELVANTTNTSNSRDSDYSFLPSSLRHLFITKCGDLDRSLRTILYGACSISKLVLSDCKNMISLPPADVMRTLTSLQSLHIENCQELVSLEGLTAFCHLQRLTVVGCSKLAKAAAAAAAAEEEDDDEQEWTVKEKNEKDVKVDDKEFTLSVDELDIDDPLLLGVERLRRLKFVRIFEIRSELRGKELDEVVCPWLRQNEQSLENLVINDVSSLTSLPDIITNLPSLKSLYLGGGHNLESLPRTQSASLNSITVQGGHMFL